MYGGRGRVYQTVITDEQANSLLQSVGEVLLEYPFTVIGASIYGKSINHLSRVLPGEGVLEGANGAILQEGMLLVSRSERPMSVRVPSITDDSGDFCFPLETKHRIFIMYGCLDKIMS